MTSPALKDPAGFSGQTWLTPSEWETYRKEVPRRFSGKRREAIIKRDGEKCAHCKGKTGILQVTHIVPFDIGVVDFGLTPWWLTQDENLALAHKNNCSSHVRLGIEAIPSYLTTKGLNLSDSPAAKSGRLKFVTVNGTIRPEFT
ncbi:hypothetical protein GC584_08075 [Corynebacterium sp. zg912]|uniref:HNH endonuclease n=1 Tax=Corynebacterium wankanglinii TaxID=2735136 RepID=A0A7V9A2I5_9CORY|nr:MULTISPECIES: hypothetical protein [Corynebacterium]MBA1838158.1 hypothetical protein [Corynebacterium wankanglinii]MCR5929367.1 hypothetical protein [Corynebacterium sp. zg912]